MRGDGLFLELATTTTVLQVPKFPKPKALNRKSRKSLSLSLVGFGFGFLTVRCLRFDGRRLLVALHSSSIDPAHALRGQLLMSIM